MAQRLVEQGEEVRLLALIDIYRPGVKFKTDKLDSWMRTLHEQGLTGVLRRAVISAKSRARLLVTRTQLLWSHLWSRVIPIDLRDFHLMEHFAKLSANVCVKKYPGRILLIRAKENRAEFANLEPDFGWTDYAEGGLDVIDVPGNHETIAQPPNVTVMAQELHDYIASIERSSREVCQSASADALHNARLAAG